MNIEHYIEPHFQPVVYGDSREIYAFEALFRFKGEHRLAPHLFPLWEKSGYVKAVDLAMMRSVHKALLEQEEKIRVAVNVSALTVEETQDAYIAEVIKLQPAAQKVIVEITETFTIRNPKKFSEFSDRCKDAGIYLALDDCGPNHVFSCPDFVRSIKPHFLKIDGVFFNLCFTNNAKGPLQELFSVAREAGATLVAEHIDSEEKRQFASKIGISLLQGNFIGLPGRLDGTKGGAR